MNEGNVNRYAQMAERKERDPFGPDGSGRAVVVNGRGFALYKRFKRGDTVSVPTLQGKWVELTRTQADVLDAAKGHIDERISMAVIADELGVARSTVWRALVKLSSFGLIAYATARGFQHGTIILRRGVNDGLDRFQREAQARVRKWAKATYERFSRLRDVVATYSLDRGRDSLTDYFLVTSSVVATSRPWTAQEIEESLR